MPAASVSDRPNGAGRALIDTPLSPLVRLIQRYAMPQTIWPSATVIMTKPSPVPRSASTANIAVTASVTRSAPSATTRWPWPSLIRIAPA